ncbi:MAG: hypothetical protein WCL32_20200 [Planctomycetota bacterium]
MKQFTCLAGAVLGAAILIGFVTKPSPAPEPAVVVDRPPASRPSAPIAAPKPMTFADEPILVLADIEVAPLPEPSNRSAISVPISNAPLLVSDSGKTSTGPRPESIREGRPWMPYASEDAELSATRKLEWTKIAIREAAARPRDDVFEETQEPPLISDGQDEQSR